MIPIRAGRLCLIWGIGLLSLCVTALGQALPDAIHVREKINQEVEFQDKIEAVANAAARPIPDLSPSH